MNMFAIYNNKVQEEIHISKTHNSSTNSHIQPVKIRNNNIKLIPHTKENFSTEQIIKYSKIYGRI